MKLVFGRLLRGEGFHPLRSAAERQAFERPRTQQISRKGTQTRLSVPLGRRPRRRKSWVQITGPQPSAGKHDLGLLIPPV